MKSFTVGSNTQSRLDIGLFYGLLVLLVWLPLPLGSNRPWAWGIMELVVFIITIGAVVTYLRTEKLSLSPYKIPILLWTLFLLICILQFIPMPANIVSLLSPQSYHLYSQSMASDFFLSVDSGQSRIMFFKSLAYFMLFVSCLILINSEERLRTLLIAMLVCGSVQALYGTIEVLSGAKHSLIFSLSISESATGSFVYKNHYANFLMICLSAGIGLIVASLQREKPTNNRDWLRSIVSTLLGSKSLIRISLAVMVIALVMSKSRMGNTAFFAAMTLVGLLSLFLIKNRTRGLSILIISMFVIDLFIVSAWFGLDKVQQRLTETSLSQESRDEVVKDAIPIAKDFILTGSGAGSFYSIFPKYKQSEVDSFYDHAHNDYLQTAIEYGLLGFLLLASLISLSLFQALKAMHKRRNSLFRGAAFGCSMAILGMLIHMTVDFPLQAPANAAYFVVLVAISWKLSTLKTRRSRISSSAHS